MSGIFACMRGGLWDFKMYILWKSSSQNPPLSAWGVRKGVICFYPSRPGGSDVELEAMESEQTGLVFSLPPSSEHVRANSPVEFAHDYLYPSPGARDNVAFGLDDILLTAASDSEDFGPALEDALPPSGHEARPSVAYSELVDVLSRTTEKLSLDWPDEPCESRNSSLNSTSGSLSAQIPYLKGGSCHFSVICIKRSPDPGSSLFPPAVPTRQPLTSPTLWVLWSRATPPFLW